jgi:hypothetical protein
MFDSAELFKVNDRKCMVVLFVNENKKPIGVGFQAWLQAEDKKKGRAIVDCTVYVWWPSTVDGKVPDAKKFLKRLSHQRSDWNLTSDYQRMSFFEF